MTSRQRRSFFARDNRDSKIAYRISSIGDVFADASASAIFAQRLEAKKKRRGEDHRCPSYLAVLAWSKINEEGRGA